MTLPAPSQAATPLPQHQFGLQLATASRYLGTLVAATSRYAATESRASSGVAATVPDAVAAPDSTKCRENKHSSGVAAQRAGKAPPRDETAATSDPGAF